MPGDSEHPVTVEALYVVQSFNDIRSATVADLVSALRAEGVDFIEQWEYNHFEHCGRTWPHPDDQACMWPLPDALAEAQPFPPAGGVS